MNRARVTGLILAGGLGRRMGGADKGLQCFRGRPMVEWVIARLRPQVETLLINCNQNATSYAAYGYPVVADEITGFAGPLAGLHAGLMRATTPLLASSPCDSPFLPLDLVERLVAAMQASQAELAVAKTADQPHPVFSLCRREVLDSLVRFLGAGGRKIDVWYATLNAVEVAFDDEANAFANINTLAELTALERMEFHA